MQYLSSKMIHIRLKIRQFTLNHKNLMFIYIYIYIYMIKTNLNLRSLPFTDEPQTTLFKDPVRTAL